MTDKDIHLATGIPPSTFHRWRKGDIATAPDLDKVRRFCAGLGIDPAEVMAALGLFRTRTTPAPPSDPDLLLLQRKLADPNVSDFTKAVIREMIKLLARGDKL